VRELRQGETRIMVGDVDEILLAQLAKSGISAASLEKALKPILDKKAELSGLQRRLEALQNERNTIGVDQQRLRENMKALRGSAEEKQLLQRYTRQLDAQETRLDALQTEIARTETDMEKVRGELGGLISTVSFDLATSSSEE
jgi:chromosome segregation ATPase